MQFKNIYDTKIIILDLDFYLIHDQSFDKNLSIQKIINKIAASQNLIITTNSCAHTAIKMIENWNLKVGHLISNSGCCIYNISSKKNFLENLLNKETAKAIFKQAFWNNLNFLINTKNNGSYSYCNNHWLTPKYKTDLNRLALCQEIIDGNWKKLTQVLRGSKIYSIEIFFHESDNCKRQQKINKFLSNFENLNLFNYSISDSVLYICSPKTTVLDGIKKLAAEKKIDLLQSSLYCGVDQYSSEIIQASYFSFISDQLLINNHEKYIYKNFYLSFGDSGSKNWVDWFNDNAYLWTEPVKEKYKNFFAKTQYATLKTNDFNEIKNKKSKFVNLNLANREMYLKSPVFYRETQWLQKKIHKNQQKKIKKIFFWPEQIEWIISLINSKN